MKYRFLLFDADLTLLDFDTDMVYAFQKLYEVCGFSAPYSPMILETYEKCNNRWWEKFEKKECTKPELFLGRFVDFLRETGLSGDPEEMNRRYFEFLGQGGAVYPGAVELVKKLSDHFSLYIVTNGNASSQKTRLEHSGLLPYIKEYFVSDAVGVGKPDPRYFQYVFDHIPGFRREQAVVIGDSLSSDIQGAVNANIDSIWYTGTAQAHGKVGGQTDVPYTYRAETYEEIEEILYSEE